MHKLDRRLEAELVGPDATLERLDGLIDACLETGAAVTAVTVDSHALEPTAKRLAGTGIRVGCTAGYPLGGVPEVSIWAQAAAALSFGARQMTVALPLDALKENRFEAIRAAAARLRDRLDRGWVDLFLLAAADTLTPEQQVEAARICLEVEAGCRFGTVFGLETDPAVVLRLRQALGPALRISVFAREVEAGIRLLAAGADRIVTPDPARFRRGFDILEQVGLVLGREEQS